MTIKSCATCGGLYATAPGELFAGTPCRCVCPSSNEPLGMTTETDALPESVRRFDCTNGGAQWCQGCYTMTECDDGDYVRSEDYDRLTARVQELERENGELREQCGTLREARIVSVDVTGEEVWLDGDDYGGKRVALLPLDDEAKA